MKLEAAAAEQMLLPVLRRQRYRRTGWKAWAKLEEVECPPAAHTATARGEYARRDYSRPSAFLALDVPLDHSEAGLARSVQISSWLRTKFEIQPLQSVNPATRDNPGQYHQPTSAATQSPLVGRPGGARLGAQPTSRWKCLLMAV